MAGAVITGILSTLQLVEQLLPAATGIAAAVEKTVDVASGNSQFSETDVATFKQLADTLDAAVDAKIAAEGDSAAGAGTGA